MGVWRAAARVTAGDCALGSTVGGCGAASPGLRRLGGMFIQPRGREEENGAAGGRGGLIFNSFAHWAKSRGRRQRMSKTGGRWRAAVLAGGQTYLTVL